MNRKILAVAVAGAMSPTMAQALDISVSGIVDRAIRFADNGAGSDVQHVSGPSPTQFAFTASEEVMPGLIAGGRIEVGAASNGASGQDIDVADNAAPAISYRHSYLYLTGNFGRITMGHTNPAGKGAMFGAHNDAWAGTEYSIDHTSAISVMSGDGMDYGCRPVLPAPTVVHAPQADGTVNHTVTAQKCGHTVFDFLPSINEARANVLRYNSPAIGPVTFEGSLQKDPGNADDQMWGFGARLSHDVGAAQVIGRLGIKEDELALSGGIKFVNGTAVNAAWGTDEDGMNAAGTPKDYEDMYLNLSHGWGNMAVALDYRVGKDSNSDMEGRKIGLGANYAVGGGVNVYAGFHNYSFDMPGEDLDDVNSFHVGTSVSFN